MNPFFSIIIPCYNQAHFLSDCLNSIKEQFFESWEALVINDGSPDNTSEIVIKFALEDKRIKLIEKKNGGLSSARNEGIRNAQGDFIIFLDADDLIINNCLHEYSKILNENNLFVQCGYQSFSKINKIIYKRKNIIYNKDFHETILFSNVGPVNGFVISKKIIKKVGFFDEGLTSCEDWDYWIRFSKLGYKPYIVNEIFAAFRYVRGSMGKNSLRMLEQGIKVLNIHHISTNSTLIIENKFIENEVYKKACINYLFFAISIALFNKQIEFLEKIKMNYIEKSNFIVSKSELYVMSNYQTYRNLSFYNYIFFYFRSKNDYYNFMYYLLEKNIVVDFVKNDFISILPSPLQKIKNYLKK